MKSVETMRECFAYAPETGEFHWKRRPAAHFNGEQWRADAFNTRFAGRNAGGIARTGYLTAKVNGQLMLMHRVAWAIHHGAWPTQFIDHINNIRADNRIANLRDVSRAENAANRSDHFGSERLIGVRAVRGGRFHAYQNIGGGRQISLGGHATPEAAAAAVSAYRLAAGLPLRSHP